MASVPLLVENEVIEELLCKSCRLLPKQKVFQCQNGHSLCACCHQNRRVCPNCGSRFDKEKPIRNLFFEEQVEKRTGELPKVEGNECAEAPDDHDCSICFNLPEQEVYQCKNGHPLCATCHEEYQKCPTCTRRFDKVNPIRNLFYEELLDKYVKVDCAYKLNGCEDRPTRKLVQDHLSKCHFNIEKFGQMIKVCKLIGLGDCGFCFNNGNILDAVKHFEILHGCILTEGDHWQMELIGFKDAADSDGERIFWAPVISDLKERNYFILTCASLDCKAGSFSCFSLIMPNIHELNSEFEKTIKIEYSVSNNSNDPLEWRSFQYARHFSKVGPHSAYDAPCCFSLQNLKFHTSENGSLLLNVRVHEIVAKNSTKVIKKKGNKIVCQKGASPVAVTSNDCYPVQGCAQFEASALRVTKDSTKIKVEKLPDSVTKEYTKIIFSKFGEIRSIDMFKFGPNTCLIDFADVDSVRKVVEKKRPIFMKKNGKKYPLDVFISYQGEHERSANNGSGDQAINMTLAQSKNKQDLQKLDRDELMGYIKEIYSNSRAWADEIHCNHLKKVTFFRVAIRGNVESVQYCIGKGIDVNMVSEDDEAASVIAYTMLDKDKKIGLEKAKLLIENGANVQFKDGLGRSLLHHSVRYGSDDAVKFFLDKGLEVNAVSKAGETPLHVALSNTRIPFLIQKVKLLVDHGADLNIKDNKRQSCLDLVEEAPFEYWDQIKAIFKKHQEQGNAVLKGES